MHKLYQKLFSTGVMLIPRKIYSEIAKRENLILDAFNVVWPL